MLKWIVQVLSTFLLMLGTVMLTVPLTLWTIDRNGPYERLFGVIVPGKSECGPDANYFDEIKANGCVVVEWTVDLHDNYRSCVPVNSLHVSRTITGSDGITHELEKTERYFGPGRQSFSEKLRRPFILPDISVPGPADYYSKACFICNPLQKILNWPVCIDTPKVRYEVSK
jgi:hypothetical protein